MIQIVMSTYNGERWIGEQLDSIIGQSYADWELLVRDDGSEDRTPLILEAYAARDARIRVLPRKGHRGIVDGYRWLLEQTDAPYIAFADQDDVWRQDKLAIQMQLMQEQEARYGSSGPIVVHTDLKVVDEELREIAPSFWEYANIRPALLESRKEYMGICNPVTGCAMLMNAAAREVALPFPPQIYMHDAWIGLSTMLRGGHVAYSTKTPILYRQHGGNVMGAQVYRFTLGQWRHKYRLARRAYRSARPMVWRNRWQFVWWKMRYFGRLHGGR